MIYNGVKYRAICDCSSYRFPHRAGGGKCACSVSLSCKSDFVDGKYVARPPVVVLDDLCEGCGQPSDTKEMDFGIGHYEFWGACGFDTNIQRVTECCEAGLVDNTRKVADSHPEWFK